MKVGISVFSEIFQKPLSFIFGKINPIQILG